MSHRYRFVDHTADLAVEATADNREGLLLASLEALAEVLGIAPVPEGESEHIVLHEREGADEERLVAVLNDWLFQVIARGLRPVDYDVTWTGEHLVVDISARHAANPEPLAAEIKAVTYHGARVAAPEHPGAAWTAFWIADV